jgi:hypothetical protein
MRLAQPLCPEDRSSFLAEVAAELRASPVVGDGLVNRIGAELQRKYLRPSPGVDQHPTRWARSG